MSEYVHVSSVGNVSRVPVFINCWVCVLGMCVVSVPGVCQVFGVCTLVPGYVSRQCQVFV